MQKSDPFWRTGTRRYNEHCEYQFRRCFSVWRALGSQWRVEFKRGNDVSGDKMATLKETPAFYRNRDFFEQLYLDIISLRISKK